MTMGKAVKATVSTSVITALLWVLNLLVFNLSFAASPKAIGVGLLAVVVIWIVLFILIPSGSE